MSATSKSISKDCSAIAFYGIEPSAKGVEGFYRTVVNWFSELGCPPDKVGITGPEHSGKLVSFSHGNTKLQKTGFENITGVEIVSTLPDARVWGRDYLLTASYDASDESLDADIVGRASLANLSPRSMLPVARTLAMALKPAYGIGFTLPHKLGPELYAIGVNHSGGAVLIGEAYEEALNVSRWCDTGMVEHVYREGLLRDVYPWNFLTKPHLARKVGRVPLERWIRQNASRGTLSVLCQGVWLWEVPEPDIPDVRRALRQAGAIFDWRTYSSPEE